ncbi:MAG: peptide deformylase [Candidatus Aminicenantes bacterium]|nr:peptide deformylase [Candidatus Aminicenantes bacterium]
MPVRKIVTFGHPVLHRAALTIRTIDQEIVDLARDMVLTMHAAPGIGLAAPQVAAGKRLITVDLSVGEKAEELIILINPEFLGTDGEAVSEEGCLSVPGVHEDVRRPGQVAIKGIDLEGNERVIEAEGLLARVFCHELDHLEGRLFIEHLSPLKKTLIKKRLKKTLENDGRE